MEEMEDRITVAGHSLEVSTLVDKASEAAEAAYVPYSQFRVGAVAVDCEGGFHLGANIENASYGLTCCAERSAIFAAVLKKKSPILVLAVYGMTPEPISPCGACRQVIKEFAHPGIRIILSSRERRIKIFTMEELLPYSFGPEHLGK